jgi:prepilin-type N-terminal cleavage/methylation domain-containing protein
LAFGQGEEARMKVHGADDGGFSLVEVVIAMFILGVIAVSLLPALWQGVRFSVEQAEVATATRQLNALVEAARDAQTCSVLNALAPSSFRDGAIVSSGSIDFTVDDGGFTCVPSTLNTITLTATGTTGALVVVSAKIWAKS